MKCGACKNDILYTPQEIIGQAKASGLFVRKLDFCVNAYESYFPGANKGRIILNYRMLSEALVLQLYISFKQCDLYHQCFPDILEA